ncbi:uncharacterized protein LOC127569811 [Pristis pectinata]|uniref:uncharacterized protein LOC127569811 n=1 Tax=Pristis pectinata TaxID=685728 RepID=UPI00223D757A|nr:uncharacterized protein LOC127569811 [Pristis pectinata]
MSQCPKGGAVIHHKVVDGKHRYRIQEVLHCKGTHSPFRRGDHLLQVNEKNVSDFPPETLAELLREKSTLMTVHRPNNKAESAEPGEAAGVVYWPYDRQKMELQFSLDMVRMDGGCVPLENLAAAHSNDKVLPADVRGKDKICRHPEIRSKLPNTPLPSSAREKNGGVVHDKDKAWGLLVALNHATVSIMQARGPHCSSGVVCTECKKKDCEIHAVNVGSEVKPEVYCLEEGLSPTECCGMIMKVMNSDYPFLIHNERDQYLRPGSNNKRIVLSRQNSESAQVTIFYYKSNNIPKAYCGIPVVLKFSKTSCFLMCQSEGSNVLLRIEECTSELLKRIPEGSPQWRFIFYMKERQDGTLSFESAQYPGWFINNQWTQKRAEMKQTMEETLNADFIFILLKV